MKNFWEWFWYNDATRILGVLLGGFAVLIYTPIVLFFGEIEYLFTFIYLAFFFWALYDNDYTKSGN